MELPPCLLVRHRPISPCLCRFLAAVCLLVCLAATASADPTGIPGYVVLPLVLLDRSNQAAVSVDINGHRTLLIVDTGGPMTLLDSAFYRGILPKTGEAKPDELPPELRKGTSANGQKADFAMVGSLKVGGVELGKRPVVVTDLESNYGRYNYSHRDRSISGLLGEDILHQNSAIIDWRRRGLYLNIDKSKRFKLGPGLTAAGWTAIPMSETNGRHFSVQATVEGKPVRLLVDTGAGYTSFAPNVVKFSQMIYHLDDSVGTRLHTTAMTSTMINAKSTSYPAKIEHWKLGNYEIASSVVAVHEIPSQILKEDSAGEGPVLGLVGAEVLSANNAIIDVGGRTLYLKPSKR